MRRLAKWVAGIGVALAFAPAAAQAEELDWQPCDPGFQCATASVPRDYAHPRGPEVQIALIRRPASDPEHRIGSIFVNPGGPGGSGIDFVRTAPPGALAAFGRLYDFVGFDPRGVGRSTPAINGCGILYTHRFEMTDSLDLPSLLRRTRDQLRACEAGSGGILPYLTTANVARDLDRLRAAVGDERLNYIGLSWGTQLGATYTSLFPRRVGAFILDAPADPDVWINRPYEATREQVASFESSFARFLHWCTRNASVCTLDPDDPENDVDALIAAMNAAPLQGETTGDDLISVAGSALYSKYGWAPLARAISAAKAGDGSGIRTFLGDVSQPGNGEFFAYMANENRYGNDVHRYLDETRHQEAIGPHFGIIRHTRFIGTAMWPWRARSVYRGPFRNADDAPTPLVIAGTHDPATPYAWGRRYVRQLGNARLLTYRSDGHGALTDLNPCVSVWALGYLETGALPPEGATCTQSVPAPGLRRAVSDDDLLMWKRTTQP